MVCSPSLMQVFQGIPRRTWPIFCPSCAFSLLLERLRWSQLSPEKRGKSPKEWFTQLWLHQPSQLGLHPDPCNFTGWEWAEKCWVGLKNHKNTKIRFNWVFHWLIFKVLNGCPTKKQHLGTKIYLWVILSAQLTPGVGFALIYSFTHHLPDIPLLHIFLWNKRGLGILWSNLISLQQA